MPAPRSNRAVARNGRRPRMIDAPIPIDVPAPPAFVQLVQAPSAPLHVVPSQPPPSQPPGQNQLPPIPDQVGPGLYPPPQAAPGEGEPEQIDVTPLDVGRYVPWNALYVTLVITVAPPSGTVAVYTPGFEAAPVLFRGPKTSGEIRLNGPTVYIHLQDGATGYSVEYLSYRVP
jgi:hypothetical protein